MYMYMYMNTYIHTYIPVSDLIFHQLSIGVVWILREKQEGEPKKKKKKADACGLCVPKGCNSIIRFPKPNRGFISCSCFLYLWVFSPQVHAAKQTFSSFDDLLKNTKTALLVDFYATW